MTLNSLWVALRALLANRLRSTLTMLGILMGTAAVILLVAVGAGISNQVQGQIGKLGTNALYVLNERTTGGRDRGGTNARQIQLTPQDVKALEDKTRAPSVARVTPGASATGTLTWNGITYPLGSFLGVEPVFGQIRNLAVQEGRWLSDADQADHAKAAVIGTTVVEHVFGPGVDPVGRTVEFNNVEFKIVGLLQHRGSNGTMDQDDVMYAPLSTVVDEVVGDINALSYSVIAVQAVSRDGITPAAAQVTATLRQTLLLHVVRPTSTSTVLFSAAPVVHVDQPVRTPLAVVPAPEAPTATGTTYIVKPYDDLWSLAEDHLGDGHRWRELFELNRGRLQPHGDALRRPNLVRPGWILRFPDDAVGLTDGGKAPADTAPTAASPVSDQTPTATPASSEPAPVSVAPSECPIPPPAPTAVTSMPAPSAPAAADEQASSATSTTAAKPSAPPQEPSPSPGAGSHKHGHGVAAGVLGASLLAAGVVTTLDRLRRAQQRRRPPRRAVRMPSVSAIPTEIALRRAAAGSPATRLDLALRAFARCAATRNGGNPPAVSAVQAGAGIELLLSEPVEAEPGPFSLSAAGQVWTLPPAVSDTTLEGGTSDIGAPLPALVSVGALGNSTILVDLEAAGCTALAGDEEAARTAFRAIALELATSIWADTLDVVIVAAEEEPFRTLERVRVSPTLAEILPDIEAAAGALNDALARLSSPTTFSARLGGTAADGWVPTIVLCANPGAEPDAFSHLLALAGAGARGLAVVAVGDVPDAGRVLRFNNGAVEVTPPGVTLAISGPTSQQMTEVEKILSAAADCDGVEAKTSNDVAVTPVPTGSATVLNAPYVDDDFDVLVRVLGPVEVEGAKEPIDRRKAVELVVYLATHPKGLDDEQLRTALWPDGAPQASFNTTVTRARSRLGTAEDGSHHLPHVVATGGVYRVGPRVTTDFVLLERRLRAARTAAPDLATRTLRPALDLVRGIPFAGVRQGYEWGHAEGFVARMETVVAEAAHHLAQLALEARDADLAGWAACQGLLASPGDEVLFRDRMLACDLAGNPAGVEAVMDELVAAVEAVEPYDTLHAETVALYERLSHRRRRTG